MQRRKPKARKPDPAKAYRDALTKLAAANERVAEAQRELVKATDAQREAATNVTQATRALLSHSAGDAPRSTGYNFGML